MFIRQILRIMNSPFRFADRRRVQSVVTDGELLKKRRAGMPLKQQLSLLICGTNTGHGEQPRELTSWRRE